MEENKSTASQLDGLPDVDRRETEEILSEIEKEENKDLNKGDSKDKVEPQKEVKPKSDDVEKKPEVKDEKPSERKQPSLMPRYVHEIAVKKLNEEIEALKSGKSPESKEEVSTEDRATLEAEINKIAEKHKLDATLVRELAEIGMKFGGKLPADLQEKLQHLDKIREQSEIQAEELAFNNAFDKTVMPLIKAEYGDLPKDTVEAIRELMMKKAYSDEYAKTPFEVIYKGLDDFRNYKRMPNNSAENSDGVNRNGADEGTDEFENITEEDIDKMDSKTFDRYTVYQEKKERGLI